ncbi:cell division protein FtsH [Candidatus Peregrinibacteria bacterium CG11_big_fil_rev_8_21_14_0_20_41_10]|nr:MAG: cell division protein FtsH [Candidatus Peregrinibacteria bacterium CG11_big_fil_rev_8_21_14_0_20_41_10]PJC37675.1 MAG: cell division protein FtsH [Candidatus Peregrinibacteria bacterium CG_4_9_14_0_2_um_filter_41_14]
MKKPQPKTKSSLKSFGILIITALVISSFIAFNQVKQYKTKEVSLSEFHQHIKKAQIDGNKIQIEGDKISYILTNTDRIYTFKEPNSQLNDILTSSQINNLNVKVKPTSNFWYEFLFTIVPFLLIAGFFVFMFRQAQSNNNQAMSFGKSRARLHDQNKKSALFKDVAGADEAKEELVEVVDFLKNPKKYLAMGAKIPKGILLIGAPGTGKTLLARAVAGEAKVPFYSISGSEFVEMFVGVGASRVRDLFKEAKASAPCIIFIDEIDAVGRKRGAGLGGGHDEREQTLNQILTEMDGFETDTNVIVMAATNRADVLDSALLRPGRFDRRVIVDKPNIIQREAILKVHSQNKPTNKDIDLMVIARQTPGFSGADLENLVNEAAIIAAKKGQTSITQHNLEISVEKVTIGLEKKSRKLSDNELKITAYHEVGHAVIGHKLPDCDPVNKISIISRGQALGVTWFLPENDSHLYPQSKFESEICSLLGGYCAEEIFFNQVTTGASSDLERATEIARNMVTRYGMSKLGPVIFGDKDQEVFIGKDLGHYKNYSETYAAKIDDLIKEIIHSAYEKTKKMITEHKKIITTIAEDLLKKETINRKEFLAYFSN